MSKDSEEYLRINGSGVYGCGGKNLCQVSVAGAATSATFTSASTTVNTEIGSGYNILATLSFTPPSSGFLLVTSSVAINAVTSTGDRYQFYTFLSTSQTATEDLGSLIVVNDVVGILQFSFSNSRIFQLPNTNQVTIYLLAAKGASVNGTPEKAQMQAVFFSQSF